VRYRQIFLGVTFVVAIHGCKSLSGGSKVQSQTSSDLIQNGNLSTQDVIENARVSARELPSGDYHIEVVGDSDLKPSECAALKTIEDTGLDSRNIQQEYANLLGFERCRISRESIIKCRRGFNCSRPMVQDDSGGVYLTLIGFDQDPWEDARVCPKALAPLKTVNGSPYSTPPAFRYAVFEGVTRNSRKVKGCRYRLMPQD